MKLDISNHSPRQIRCVSNDDRGRTGFWYNATHLTVGQTYNLRTIEINVHYTVVTLLEFPYRNFNAELFEEVEE